MNPIRTAHSPRRWFLAAAAGLWFLLLAAGCAGEAGSHAGQAQEEAQPAAQERQIPGGDPDLGKRLIASYGCDSCHTIPGVPGADQHVGPPLTDWSQRRYIAGNLVNNPENLIYWIRFPQAVEPGTVMPNLGVAEEDAAHIAAYLYTLDERDSLVGIWSAAGDFFSSLFAASTPESAEPVPAAGGTPTSPSGEAAGTPPEGSEQPPGGTPDSEADP